MVHGNSAYFPYGHDVYSYTVLENKWTKLQECKYEYFAMAVINDTLTTIGGEAHLGAFTNTLLSLSGRLWEEVLPPMPTKRTHPSAANTPTHLVVAGGQQSVIDYLATVEVLNTKTFQCFTASSLPQEVGYPQMTTRGGCIYLASHDNKVFSCPVKDLLKSTNSSDGGYVWTRLAHAVKSSDGGSVWTRLAHALKFTNSSDGGSVWRKLARVPTPWGSSLATLRGHVLAIGGSDTQNGGNPTGAIHCYDVATNSWSVIGEIPTPRSQVLTAVLPSKLVVVGGLLSSTTTTTTRSGH